MVNKPIAFLTFSLPSPSSLLKLPIVILTVIQLRVFHRILFHSFSRQLEDLKQFVFILLIFIIAYGIALQAVSFPGPGKFQRGFWEVLRGIVDLPYWQMYGELFLEEISGNCPCVGGLEPMGEARGGRGG